MKKIKTKLGVLVSILMGYILLLSGCINECENQVYLLSFYLTDKQTGKPYYEVSKNNPDSLQIYLNMLSPRPYTTLSKYLSSNNGYVFGVVPITTNKIDTFYLYINHADIDTLLVNNQVTNVSGKCNIETYLTTSTFNNHLVSQVASDTLHSSPLLQLIK
jgi:hypothetical protein